MTTLLKPIIDSRRFLNLQSIPFEGFCVLCTIMTAERTITIDCRSVTSHTPSSTHFWHILFDTSKSQTFFMRHTSSPHEFSKTTFPKYLVSRLQDRVAFQGDSIVTHLFCALQKWENHGSASYRSSCHSTSSEIDPFRCLEGNYACL